MSHAMSFTSALHLARLAVSLPCKWEENRWVITLPATPTWEGLSGPSCHISYEDYRAALSARARWTATYALCYMGYPLGLAYVATENLRGDVREIARCALRRLRGETSHSL